ncbi:L,D-transpeptidase family protein [Candidatus Uhrbacteria bacterium]|nr:L,D-transpeptidase family protein [Candidatus Uhrbacteria bacterium]
MAAKYFSVIAASVGMLLLTVGIGVGLRIAGGTEQQEGLPSAAPALDPNSVVSSFVASDASVFDPDAFKFHTFKEQFIADGENFIEVDLRNMKLRLWSAGAAIREVEVLSKGREGSWWETPTGKYAALAKSASAFSSIGKVYMPWSIQFYGNFFIHGWPYYPSGEPVAKGYSGGCVRLATEDAKTVFEFADLGVPILVLDEADTLSVQNTELIAQAQAVTVPPQLSATAAYVVDLDSGLELFTNRHTEKLPIASLTKLMTGVVASELIYLEKSITILPSMLTVDLPQSDNASSPLASLLASVGLATGDSYTAFDLLYPLLMQSSNDAAVAIGDFIGQNFFVKQMNAKAASLGMTGTVFADTSGKSAGNISSASDMRRLAKYIVEKRKFLFDITRGQHYSTFGPLTFAGIENYNEFAADSRLIGVKNGQTTAAGQTLLTVWNLERLDSGETYRIAMVVLGSEDRAKDTEALLAWLNTSFGLQ